MYKKKQTDPYIRWGVIGIIALILLSFGKTILNKLTSGLSFLSAKQDQKQLVAETLNNTDVRYTYVKGIVDSVVKESEKHWYEDTDEKYIVEQVNRLQSPEEVIYASNYYMQLKGKSFKSFLKEILNADWRSSGSLIGKILNPNAAGSAYADLKDIVKNNLL